MSDVGLNLSNQKAELQDPQEQPVLDLRGTASTCSRGSSSTSPLSTPTETTGGRRRRRRDHDSAQPRTLVKRERDQHKLFSHTETKDQNQIRTELQCSERATGSWIRTNLELTDPKPFPDPEVIPRPDWSKPSAEHLTPCV